MNDQPTQKRVSDGGPAFPMPDTCYPNGQVQTGDSGMTLRDYFAAKAMQAEMITSFSDATPQAAAEFCAAAKASGRTMVQHLAGNAYEIADAMIAERSKGGAK